MGNAVQVEHIANDEVLARHLDALLVLDPVLVPVRKACGDIPLRRGASGFAGMAHIIIGQLLSVASARVIHQRFSDCLGVVTVQNFTATPEADVMAVGLTRAKYATMRRLAEAELSGVLDYAVFADMSADAAIAALTDYKGIGPWTAELYLLSALGHPDVFPSGDLALQKATAEALNLADKPDARQMRGIAQRWSPYRAVAARLLWRYFAVMKHVEGVSL